MSKDTPKHEIYIEKVFVYERKSLKQVIMVMYKKKMYFLYAETFNLFMRPVNIDVDILNLTKCQMNDSQTFQYSAIELNHDILKDHYKNRTHIIII